MSGAALQFTSNSPRSTPAAEGNRIPGRAGPAPPTRAPHEPGNLLSRIEAAHAGRRRRLAFCRRRLRRRQLQDAGAGAIVMRSLFEEQIDAEQRALTRRSNSRLEPSRAASYFPNYADTSCRRTSISGRSAISRMRSRFPSSPRSTAAVPGMDGLRGPIRGGWRRCDRAQPLSARRRSRRCRRPGRGRHARNRRARGRLGAHSRRGQAFALPHLADAVRLALERVGAAGSCFSTAFTAGLQYRRP